MNLETDRLANGSKLIKSSIESRKLKDSQEYYALAVLKSLFPEEYKTLEKKETDRPDLKEAADIYGVEVTTADSKEDNEDNRLFSYIHNDNKKKKIINKIERHRKKVSEIGGIACISSGGGYEVEEDNKLLLKSICKKIESASKYASSYKYLDLVVIKNEIVPSVWEEEIFGCVDEAIRKNNRLFRNVYVIYREYCYCVFSNGQHNKLRIEKRDSMKLLGRLTAEGIIKVEDDEWN